MTHQKLLSVIYYIQLYYLLRLYAAESEKFTDEIVIGEAATSPNGV